MNRFYTFKRGTVVLVDFSPQIGSEIKGKHFAIVLTKRDRSSNELLTVIPLTSKYHKHHIDFGDEIYKSIYTKLRIIKPLNQFDPIRTLKVSNEVMDKIDKAIIDLFTK